MSLMDNKFIQLDGSTSIITKKESGLDLIYLFELFVNFTNMYWLMCDMKKQKMRKLDKILTILSLEECKTLMKRLQRDETSE